MKKTKKLKKTTRNHKRKTRHSRKSKRNFGLRTQKGGGPSDTYLLFVINCVRRYNRLNQYLSSVRLSNIENALYLRENHAEFRIWGNFIELFENRDSQMLTLFREMREELNKYNFGFLFNGFAEYTPEEASSVAQNINDQIQRIQSPGVVPIEPTVQIERLFGDPKAKPVNNLYADAMKMNCQILKEAEALLLLVQQEDPDQTLPHLPSKYRV